MKPRARFSIFLAMIFVFGIYFSGCFGKNNYLNAPEKVFTSTGDEIEEDADLETPEIGNHRIFDGPLGVPSGKSGMGTYDPDYPDEYTAQYQCTVNDLTGKNICNDYDGDGIPNDEEISNNMFVADYPRIVTKIETPITMEIRVDDTDVTKNHTELVDDTGVENTISNSMEDRHYTQSNQKTVPYMTSEAYENSYSNMDAFGFMEETKTVTTEEDKCLIYNDSKTTTTIDSHGENERHENMYNKSSFSEKMVFEDVELLDNLNREGTAFTDETVEEMTRNYRTSQELQNLEEIGPDNGYVRANLFVKNETVNMPAHISNIKCTLSFRTPAGEFLPVRTFFLRNEDYSRFEQDIYGNEELGPFVIEAKNLNTAEIKKALASGYVPQMSVVSYDMHLVNDSNYNPGVYNLKMVEETAKGRTAVIKIHSESRRDIYRVAAFDIDENGVISPGISLKKALFNILRKRAGLQEQWSIDDNGESLSVEDDQLKWKPGSYDEYPYPVDSSGDPSLIGNKWDQFETYIKKDHETGRIIEVIRRIGDKEIYYPFSEYFNKDYIRSERLSRSELMKEKVWIIYHNGRYFEGDINDPIWVGERYEIVFYDKSDFVNHFQRLNYTPIRSMEKLSLNTRWNRLTNSGEFARAMYLGKAAPSDVIKLEVDLGETRYLFDQEKEGLEFGNYVDPESEFEATGTEYITAHGFKEYDFDNNDSADLKGAFWYKFNNYTLDDGNSGAVTDVPGDFAYEGWNGVNNFRLKIQESKNAQFYVVTFWQRRGGDWDPAAQQFEDDYKYCVDSPFCRRVKFTAEDIAGNNGYVYINSRSVSVNSGFSVNGIVGNISGNDTVNNYMEYRVEVRAHNELGGVTTSTRSITDLKGAHSVFVFDPPMLGEPPAAAAPEEFSFTVKGGKNMLTVFIQEQEPDYSWEPGDPDPALNIAEYYEIEVKGPYNSTYGGDYTNPATIEAAVVGHAGYNTISIDTPSGYQEVADDTNEPGVYTVRVYAVNKNTVSLAAGDTEGLARPEGTNKQEYLYVNYERYLNNKYYIKDGKKRSYLGMIHNGYLNPRDFDLEVNFNDGSGWFYLRLTHDDMGEEDRTINCKYTSSFLNNKQKLTLYFQPPSRNNYTIQNIFYDVFRGGAEDVDVYIRTVAKPEYRDTMWPKCSINWPAGSCIENPVFNLATEDSNPADGLLDLDNSGEPYLFVNSINDYKKGYDILRYWINSRYTDASNIESITSKKYNDYWDLEGADYGDFGLVNFGDPLDFFFSPAESHDYDLKSSIVSQQEALIASMAYQETHVDPPTFRLVPGDDYFAVTELDAQYADYFSVYWLDITDPDTAVNTNDFTEWDRFFIEAVDTYNNEVHWKGIYSSKNVYLETDHDLKTFKVCVVASNKFKDAQGNDTETKSFPVCKNVSTLPLKATQTAFEKPPISYYNYGYGTFGDSGDGFGHQLTNDQGAKLMDGDHFIYDAPLIDVTGDDYYIDIYDTFIPTSSPEEFESNFTQDKFIRIVANGKNVTDPSGLGLTPVAKDLSELIYNPPANEVYIDPVSGRFVLPRPVYWNRAEDMNFNSLLRSQYPTTFTDLTLGCNYTEISDIESSYSAARFAVILEHNSRNESYYINEDLIVNGKLNKGYQLNLFRKVGNQELTRTIYPFGKNYDKEIKMGTISFWFKLDTNLTEVAASNHYDTLCEEGYSKAYSKIRLFGVNDSLLLLECSLAHEKDGSTIEVDGQKIECRLVLNNDEETPKTYPIDDIVENGTSIKKWFHMYIVWNFEVGGGLADGSKMKIFISDESEIATSASIVIDSTEIVPVLTGDRIGIMLYSETRAKPKFLRNSGKTFWEAVIGESRFNCNHFEVRAFDSNFYNYYGLTEFNATSKTTIDNIKVWDHVVEETPGWVFDYEVNGYLKGSENKKDDALHKKYGSDNNYKPNVTSDGSGVSFYY